MQIKLLKTIVSLVAGQQAVNLVDILYEKKNVNEFLIAKKLKLTINQTRNMLYKLADEGLVSFIRKKDSKKGGWYIYFWTLNTGKSLIKFKEHLDKEVESLKSQIENRKTNSFFYCPNCDLEFTQEAALTGDYMCPECGEVLQEKDSNAEIASLEKEIIRRDEILKEVNIEIGQITVKEDKARARKSKADVLKKKKEREERKKKLKKEREKEKKKSGKIDKKVKSKGIKQKKK